MTVPRDRFAPRDFHARVPPLFPGLFPGTKPPSRNGKQYRQDTPSPDRVQCVHYVARSDTSRTRGGSYFSAAVNLSVTFVFAAYETRADVGSWFQFKILPGGFWKVEVCSRAPLSVGNFRSMYDFVMGGLFLSMCARGCLLKLIVYCLIRVIYWMWGFIVRVSAYIKICGQLWSYEYSSWSFPPFFSKVTEYYDCLVRIMLNLMFFLLFINWKD